MKDRITNILLLAIVVLLGMYIYIALRDRGLIELKINAAVQKAVASEIKAIPIPQDGKDVSVEQVRQAVSDYLVQNPPKSGKNGQNASDQQVKESVEDYFKANPIQPKDGKRGEKGDAGAEGKTPQINCNTEKNRWEVRYGENEVWQLLNGQKVPCTVEIVK